MCKADQLTVLTENYRNMANCCVIFSTTVVCLAAILVGLYYKQVIPEGLPDDQHFSARLFGVGWDIFSFIVSS